MQAPPAKGGVAVVCSTLRHGLSGTQGYVSRSSRGFNEALARRSDETPKMQLQTDSGSVGTSATHTESSWIFLWGGICEISVMMGCPCSTIVGEESMKPAVRKAGSVGDAIHSPSQSLKIFPSWQTSKEIVHVDSRAATSENSPRCTRTR